MSDIIIPEVVDVAVVEAERGAAYRERLLSRLETLSRVREGRKKEGGIYYYRPNAMQFKAHQSRARMICYVGGNRAGKSTFGCAELCYHLTKAYPDWWPQERRFKGPIRAAVSSTEFPVIERVIEPKIRQYLPKDFYRIERNQRYLHRIICKDGSTVGMLTSEMKTDAYESADWDFVWCDEPQSQDKYYAMMRGLVDRRGMMVLTFTPLTEPWMKEEIVDKADGKFIDVYTVDIRDNTETIDGESILSEKAIKEFEKTLPDEVRETRIHGKFFHLKGVVYKEFGDNQISDFKYQYPDPVICVLDPHDRTPHHVIWAYVDRTDDVFIDYEMIIHCELDDLARKIRQIENERHYYMKKRLIDPNFGRKPSFVGTNRTVIQELANHGAVFSEANDNVELGHMIVRDYLHFDRTRALSSTNKPKLFFSRDRVPQTIRSMRNLQYEDWAGGKTDRDPKETEKDKLTHGAACIRYLIASKPTYASITSRGYYELSASPY